MGTPPPFETTFEGDPSDLLLAALRRESHHPPHRFVIAYGESFDPSPLPDHVPVGKPRCCFANAFRLAADAPERLRYFEGYATLDTGPNWPVRHGWCVDRAGCVVDPTWKGIAGEPLAYCGVALPLHRVQPYAYDFSRGTLDALGDRMDVVADWLGLNPV